MLSVFSYFSVIFFLCDPTLYLYESSIVLYLKFNSQEPGHHYLVIQVYTPGAAHASQEFSTVFTLILCALPTVCLLLHSISVCLCLTTYIQVCVCVCAGILFRCNWCYCSL